MLVHNHSADSQVLIVYGSAGDQIIIFNLTVINRMIFMKVGFTDSQQMWMVVKNEVFNIIGFVLKIGIACIPMSELDSSISSVTIGIPGIEVAVR